MSRAEKIQTILNSIPNTNDMTYQILKKIVENMADSELDSLLTL